MKKWKTIFISLGTLNVTTLFISAISCSPNKETPSSKVANDSKKTTINEDKDNQKNKNNESVSELTKDTKNDQKNISNNEESKYENIFIIDPSVEDIGAKFDFIYNKKIASQKDKEIKFAIQKYREDKHTKYPFYSIKGTGGKSVLKNSRWENSSNNLFKLKDGFETNVLISTEESKYENEPKNKNFKAEYDPDTRILTIYYKLSDEKISKKNFVQKLVIPMAKNPEPIKNEERKPSKPKDGNPQTPPNNTSNANPSTSEPTPPKNPETPATSSPNSTPTEKPEKPSSNPEEGAVEAESFEIISTIENFGARFDSLYKSYTGKKKNKEINIQLYKPTKKNPYPYLSFSGSKKSVVENELFKLKEGINSEHLNPTRAKKANIFYATYNETERVLTIFYKLENEEIKKQTIKIPVDSTKQSNPASSENANEPGSDANASVEGSNNPESSPSTTSNPNPVTTETDNDEAPSDSTSSGVPNPSSSTVAN
ncbi:hypothetical protein [Mycoplasmopsis canis]|uniref:hypothetical protein n=1 Tax=Mycoplasmopsis canis TaxID=29555 RepID=UPI00025AFDF4|nr:hypothetical protein [Mycoplasmopsis canis]EIE39257.1 hypothetical protein MCANUF33_02610 [Mycoplasmopsis canis UF33]